MARIRSIKPEFWTSAQVMECSPMARLLFVGMWNFADDAGRMTYSPKTLKAQIYPSDDISAADVERLIVELSSNGLVLLYSAEGKEIISITGWHHQKIDKPKPSKLPGPFDAASTTIRRKVAPDPILSEGIVSDNSDADASGAEAPRSEPRDIRKDLFGIGLTKLAAITGKTPDSCRSLVGRWLKSVNDEAIHVLGAIDEAERNRVADPVAWINKSLRPRQGSSNGRRTVHDAANDLIAKISAFDQPAPGSIRGGEGEDAIRLLPPGRRQ